MAKKQSSNMWKLCGLGLIGLCALIVVVGLPQMPFNNDTWFGFLGEKEEEEINPNEYNEQQAWSDVKIKIGIKNYYTYNHPNINGLAVQVRDSSGYVDGGTTGSDGTWTSTVETFDSGDTYTLIIGNIATSNKSQLESFVIQGQDGDSKPSYIYCGTFYYKPVIEESAIAFAWYDENYAALSNVNFTSTYTDFILDGYVKQTITGTSQGIGRDMWHETKGSDITCYFAFIFTEVNSTTSSAIRGEGSENYKTMGTPTSKSIIVCEMTEIAYQVDADGNTVGGNTAVHWFRFKFDFSGCGIPATYTAATAKRFTMSCVISFEYDYTLLAMGGSAYSSTWFSDTISAINLTT